MKKHIAFPSIEQFRTVVKRVRDNSNYHGTLLPTLKFHGTVKLHGTNASVVRGPDGEIWAQSREQVLNLEEGRDNAGFAAFAHRQHHVVNILFDAIDRQHDSIDKYTAIYGEWCGPGIMKGTALNQLPQKIFVIFGARITDNEDENYWLTPRELHGLTIRDAGKCQIYNIFQFPSYELDIDFAHPEDSQNKLVELTNAVEAECPVGKTLGVSGIGEGIVWNYNGDSDTNLMFKVKGEKHSESKVKTLAEVDPVKVASVREFVERVVTPHRLDKLLQKFLTEDILAFSRENTGQFVRIVASDVIKEESDTLAASGLDWKKDVVKSVTTAASQYYLKAWEAEGLAA